MLIVLAFLAVAETALNRISRVKAQAIAESRQTKSARALLRLVTHPERFITPLLVTVTVLQMGQAFLTTLLADRLFGARGVAVGFVLNVIVFFVLTEAVPKTWAVLSAERAALLTARPVDWLVSFPPLRLISRGADRAHQRARPRQGPQGRPVRQRAGTARHRRRRRRRRGDRARGARADREHHRVRRHRRARGDGAAAGHAGRRPRRHRHRGARPGDRRRREPPAACRGPTGTTSSASPTPRI